jgi:hypothetical protein
VALGYAYMCACTRYRFDEHGVQIARGWPLPPAAIARETIEDARVVDGMFCRFIKLELRGGRVRELVLSKTMASQLKRNGYVS